MCGIAGIVSLDGGRPDAERLTRMVDAMPHRGPNGSAVWTGGPAGLGHRRLSVIDLSESARQPLASEDGLTLLTYNGEIYNFRELRAELEGLGHRFKSRTDSEVVVHGYEEWGAACVERLNGMFAFAVWDAARRQLFLARDRYGIKPLYYTRAGAEILFASEIKALLADPAVRRRVNHGALNQYFTFQNVLTDETLFEGIHILRPGTWMEVAADTGAANVHQYWDFDFTRTTSLSQADAAEALGSLFQQAVTRQLVSDVPLGCYLSGGIDSGSITAIARAQRGRLPTFTCGFDMSSATGLELGFDERADAERLAHTLRTEHYEVVLHAGDMEHVMPELVWHLEDLRVGQCYPNYYVAKLASRFVTVVMSGAGGDELMAGYPWRYFRGAPDGSRDRYLADYYHFWQRLVPDQDKSLLFTADVWRDGAHHPTFDVFRDVIANASGLGLDGSSETLINTSLYFELKTFLHGLLVVEDKVSMAHGLETRVPFLDNDLVDFAQQLPVSYKLRGLDRPVPAIDENEAGKRRRYEDQRHDGKAILRDAMARVVPADVLARPKQGFSAPDASWFRGESIEYINTLLGAPSARIYDYLQPAYVSRMLTEHSRGERNHRLFIWSALSFEWWLRRFMD